MTHAPRHRPAARPAAPGARKALLGVLGGMGPLATADFFLKLVDETAADDDRQHIPVLISSDPDIPSRSHAIAGNGASPLPAMKAALARLREGGATCVAIPCNTAHRWFRELHGFAGLPMLHIVDAVHTELRARWPAARGFGLLATEGTLVAGVYHERLAHTGLRLSANDASRRGRLVEAAIVLVKQGRVREAGALAEQAVADLLGRGEPAVILGCTELPLALDAVGSPLRAACIDSTRALARQCVRWHRERTGAAQPPERPQTLEER